MSKDKDVMESIPAPGDNTNELTEEDGCLAPTSSNVFQEVISRCLMAAYIDEDGKECITLNMPPQEALAYIEKMRTELLMQRIGGTVAHGARMVIDALIQARVLTLPKGMPSGGSILK